jgi:hypothetical protein
VKLIIIITLLMLVLPQIAAGQDKPEYAVSFIPDSLKKNAYSITRDELMDINVTAPGRASVKSRKVVTVLDKKGESELFFSEYEDKFRHLEFAEVRVYDELGRFLDRHKKKEMEKVRGLGDNLMDDNKYYFINVAATRFPITVEFISEADLTGILDFQDFTTLRPEEAIQQSVYTITTTPDNPVRYKNYNTGIKPVIAENGKTSQFTWTLKNINASVYEPGAARRNAGWPRVVLTPTKFLMDEYPGDYNSWTSFGQWYRNMSYGANDVPEDKKTFFRSLTASGADPVAKARLLYEHLQKNYRYVSIQLGIGGFKTLPASYVAKNQFGDCKALTNYMQTLLEVVGVKSYPALINAGRGALPADPAFANNIFNHVILCIPQAKDSIWLECTSQDAPFGKLGAFTENRNALLITEAGGVLTSTPSSKSTDNLLGGHSTVAMTEEGAAIVTTRIAHSGEMFEMFKSDFWEADENDQKDFLVNDQGFKNFDAFSMEKKTDGGEKSTLLKIAYEKLHDFNAGSKRFFRPYIFNVWSSVLPANENRQTDYFFDHPFIESDTAVFELPKGFTVENLPKNSSFQCTDAKFDAQYSYDATANKVTSIIRLEVMNQRIPPARYQQTKQFFDKLLKEMEQKLIIKQP